MFCEKTNGEGSTRRLSTKAVSRYWILAFIAIEGGRIADAGRCPLSGWPVYSSLFPIGEPREFLSDAISRAGDFGDLAFDRV